MKNILFLNEKSRTKFFEDGFFSKGELASNYNDDLDQIIHTYLLDLRLEEINSFILPISINGNFFDFSGLMFAHHVRLTKQIKSCDATIVFYGILEVEQLIRLTDWARILLTPNVIYVNIAKSTFDDIKELILAYSPKNFISEPFLEKIQINPPANYETNHHNVDNEFALIQWSKHIKCYDNLPISFKNEFDSRLHFKYLKLKKDFPEIGEKNQIIIDIDAPVNILLIDDEADKGWKDFYSSFFSSSSKKINFEDSGIDFKGQNNTNVITSEVESKVIQFKPDIVLLDLRLLDSDFHKETPLAELTGLKILEKIKEINKGIQVIITTASNKAWNFNLAKLKGAYEFIIKDGFEDPRRAIEELSVTIEVSAKRAKFLKIIDHKLSSIKALINSNNHFEDKDDEEKKPDELKDDKIRKRMFTNLGLAFELLDLSYMIQDKDKYLAYCYLQLFLLIEDFTNPDSLEKHHPILYNESNQVFINHHLKQICVLQKKEGKKLTRLVFNSKYKLEENAIDYKRRMDTNFFVSSILIYKYGNTNSSVKNWTKVYNVRNDVAHEGYIPEEIEINRLLDFMLYFFDNSNESNSNLDKGFEPITYEESLKALTAKYKSK